MTLKWAEVWRDTSRRLLKSSCIYSRVDLYKPVVIIIIIIIIIVAVVTIISDFTIC